ncbi:hypothetical protein BJF93_09895 [Xaviernesmea oryzae]|uniref:Uncharacterized protein n=1 Tax=Xaviernesmea oryzae TaxID=464029 RepID=A0A1Q9AWU2_9HYPH|nr:hypothetical protein [Xaviernesmea oryzae]OLP59905.1 hypothetical protein BJF93_09895 [Xaviernesmea oryzae]SEK45912.1 hypothetical protein SAMN04487976_102234 [Xaviernesmea oryzae]
MANVDQNSPKASPAVESLRKEQMQAKTSGDELQKGLEDTFPASDPVSVTNSTTPTGRTDKGETQH